MEHKKIGRRKNFDEFLAENSLHEIRVANKDIYYIGEGFYVGIIDDRINNVYFFPVKNLAEKMFSEKLNFETDENDIGKTFSIEEGLSMNMTFNEVKGYLKDRGIKFMEGAEYNFNGEFNCLWIDDLKNYEFYFFARSKKTKMGGFKYYNFSE